MDEDICLLHSRWRPSVMPIWWCQVSLYVTANSTRGRLPECRQLYWSRSKALKSDTDRMISCGYASESTRVRVFFCCWTFGSSTNLCYYLSLQIATECVYTYKMIRLTAQKKTNRFWDQFQHHVYVHLSNLIIR